MAGKRRWQQWPWRVIHELNGTSGLASVGGAILTGIGFAGWNAFSHVTVAVMGAIGLLITAGAVGVAAWQAIPPPLKAAKDLVGRRLALDQLDTIDPPLLKVSVVGPSLSGKSTLIAAVLHRPPPHERTQDLHAYVAALQTAPTEYVAMLDAYGRYYAGAFGIASLADVLLIVLDHSRSDHSAGLEEDRMVDHSRFQEQLRGYLKTQTRKRLWVHLLMNKRDLWERASTPDVAKLRAFLRDEEKAWQDSNLAVQVTSARHSNRDVADVTELVRRITGFVREHHG